MERATLVIMILFKMRAYVMAYASSQSGETHIRNEDVTGEMMSL